MYFLTKEEYTKLVNGKFTRFKCTSCDGNGWYWVHETGTKRNPTADESEDDFYRHECNFDENDCDGLGFNVVFHD